MSDKKKIFMIQIFNVPMETTQKTLTLSHANIESWELLDVSSEKGRIVANIKLHTHLACNLYALKEAISVQSGIHTINKEHDLRVWYW